MRGLQSALTYTFTVWLLSFGFMASPAVAQTNWTDATGSWFVPGNWSAGVPSGATTTTTVGNGGTAQIAGAAANAGNNLVINGSSTVDVQTGGSLTAGAITIGPDGTLTVGGGGSIVGSNVTNSSDFNINSGGTFNLSGTLSSFEVANRVTQTTLGGGTLRATTTTSVTDNVAFAALTTSTVAAAAGQTLTLSGNIVGVNTGASVKIGSATDTGTVVFAPIVTTPVATPGTQTYEVVGGTWLLAGLPLVGMGLSTTVDAGATLAFNGIGVDVHSLLGAGTVATGSVVQFPPMCRFFGCTTNQLTLFGLSNFSGAITGVDGLVVGYGAGDTAILTGTNTYTGGTMIVPGATLQLGNGGASGSILGGVADNGTLIFNRPDSYIFPGAISGTGGLQQNGTGIITLTGASSYTGPTALNAGILEVDGSLVSAVTVNNGGKLMGTGTIGGLSVMSGGTVLPGDAIGTLNVNGNVAFAAGSTYQVEINAAGQGSKIAATGKAVLNGGTVQVTADPGTYYASLRYTILTAGGVSGTFARLTTASNLAFLSPQLSYGANDVSLGFAQTANLTSAALTGNEFATAAAIQALGPSNAIFNAVVSRTSTAGARQAFNALSGEIYASAVTAAFEDQRLPREAILDRLSRPAEQSVLGTATTMTGAYAADLPSRKGPALAPVAVQMVQPRLFGLWGQGFGDWGTTDGDHNAGKLSRDTGGFIIGADAERKLWNGDWRFGVAGGYTDDSLKVSTRNSSGDYQSIFGALYGKAGYGAIDLKAGAILASTDTHTNRSIVFPGFADAASSSYSGYAAQGFGELSYNLPFHWTIWSYVPGLESLKVNYEPFLQGAVIHVDQNRYAETALTGAALLGAANGYDLGTTTLGWRTQYQLAGLPGFTLSTLLGWRHAFGDVVPKVSESFISSFSSFTVAGVPIDRDAFVTETALDYAVSNRMTVGLSYSGQYGRRASDSAFKGYVEVSFW